MADELKTSEDINAALDQADADASSAAGSLEKFRKAIDAADQRDIDDDGKKQLRSRVDELDQRFKQREEARKQSQQKTQQGGTRKP